MSEVIDTIPQYKLKNPWAKDVFVLLQCGVSIGIAPTGTMGANGAVTLGTALNTTYSGGIWLYYPSGAVYSGSAAGFFWTVMSSTTLGTVYNNIYVPGTNAFDIPASPTAVSDAGPGAFTGVTSEITALSVTVPGGLMGNNGSILSYGLRNHNNSAGNKTLRIKYGATTIANRNDTTSVTSAFSTSFSNMGSTSRQMIVAGSAGGLASTYLSGTTSGAVNTIATEDTSINNNMSVTMQLATATDHTSLAHLLITVMPS